MKLRLLRGALALCLLLSMAFSWTIPAAADGEPEASGAPLIEAVNVSNAGAYEISHTGVDGYYESANQFPEAVADAIQESEQMYRFRYQFLGTGVPLITDADTPTPIYLRASGEPTTHELMLYGRQKLDPSMFTITTGAQQTEDFTGGHYGDGDGTLYWYRTVIEIPAESNYIAVMYRQERAVFLDALRVQDITATYLNQIRNAGFETDENGNITSFTVEASGFNLPTDPAAYSMKGCTLTSLTGPDETGIMTFVFAHDDPEEVIQWKDLIVYGGELPPFCFDQYKVEEGEGFRSYYSNNDTENGAYFSVPTPYYTLKRGGGLDEQSAPCVVCNADGAVLDVDIAVYRDSANLFCASYDGNGVMTGLEALETGTPLVFTAADGAARVKLLTLDETLAPLCAAKTIVVS